MAQDVTRAREHLIAPLEGDLIGPYEKPGGLDASDELLKLPFRYYPRNVLIADNEVRDSWRGIKVVGPNEQDVAFPGTLQHGKLTDCDQAPARCASQVSVLRNRTQRTSKWGISMTRAGLFLLSPRFQGLPRSRERQLTQCRQDRRLMQGVRAVVQSGLEPDQANSKGVEMRNLKMNPQSRSVLALILLSLSTVSPGRLFADPIQAVFFDLGDTLVEDVGGGMFGLRPGAAETVELLQDLAIELGIITNVPSDWTLEDLEAILVEPEFLDEFSVIVLSSQAPAPKPDPAIYSFAHSLLSVPVPITETAFVGETLGEIANAVDNPTEGCRAVGMVGIHLSDQPPSPLTDYTIPTDDLPQVAAIVAGANGIFADGFESGDTSAWGP